MGAGLASEGVPHFGIYARATFSRALLIALLSGSLIGCSLLGSHDALVDRLQGRGPVNVSTDNPYLAGNLLLSREMATSPELKGFVDHRGSPQALEVEASFLSPVVLKMYYTDKQESYDLEASDSTWIIRGPFPLESSKARELSAVSGTRTGVAKGMVPPKDQAGAGREESALALARKPRQMKDLEHSSPGTTGFKSSTWPDSTAENSATENNTAENNTVENAAEKASSSSATSGTSEASSPDPFLERLEQAYRRRELEGAKAPQRGFTSPSEETQHLESISKQMLNDEPSGASPESGTKAAAARVAKVPTPIPPSFLPPVGRAESTKVAAPHAAPEANSEQQFLHYLAEHESENKAEITPKGDLVHYVTLPGESLSYLARWYTFDRENARRLARMNNIKNPDQLNVGDVVVVPSYLVKNQRRLTESALKAIQVRVQESAGSQDASTGKGVVPAGR